MQATYLQYLLSTIKCRKKTVIASILLVFFCVAILDRNYTSFNLYLLYLNINCYNVKYGDALQVIGEDFAPPEKSIYFHETSCSGQLNSRQACSLESAATVHPDWEINVLFTAPVTRQNLNTGSLKVLKKFKNINYRRLHMTEYVKGTPLQSLVAEGRLTRSIWPISHTSDALRYLSLYKWGGVYLDLDVVVAKSFEDLAPNWAARETNITVAAGALAFSRDKLGRKIAGATLREFRDSFRGDLWGHNGPGVITRTLQRICKTDSAVNMSAASYKGVKVLEPEYFYPIPFHERQKYFTPMEWQKWKKYEIYTYQFWDHFTKYLVFNENTLYGHIAKEYCPMVYTTYGKRFGTL